MITRQFPPTSTLLPAQPLPSCNSTSSLLSSASTSASRRSLASFTVLLLLLMFLLRFLSRSRTTISLTHTHTQTHSLNTATPTTCQHLTCFWAFDHVSRLSPCLFVSLQFCIFVSAPFVSALPLLASRLRYDKWCAFFFFFLLLLLLLLVIVVRVAACCFRLIFFHVFIFVLCLRAQRLHPPLSLPRLVSRLPNLIVTNLCQTKLAMFFFCRVEATSSASAIWHRFHFGFFQLHKLPQINHSNFADNKRGHSTKINSN